MLPGPGTGAERGKFMKYKWPVILLSLACCMAPFGAIAEDSYAPGDSEKLFGTWANQKMLSIQKVVVFPGGFREYMKVTDTDPVREVTLTLESNWKDSAGNVWYKAMGSVTGGADRGWKFMELYKVSESGTKWELAFEPVFNFDPLVNALPREPKCAKY
jgi:hypothetical protein